MPAILRWFTANIGVHHIHHLSSNIPYYRLRTVLRDHPELRGVARLTLWQSFRCVRLVLWDEGQRRLVSFRASPRGDVCRREAIAARLAYVAQLSIRHDAANSTPCRPTISKSRRRPKQEARDRRAANIFLLVAGAVLVGIGVWLANAMIDARRADDCMSSGRRNCNPIEAPQR